MVLRGWAITIAILWVIQDAIVFPGWWFRREDPVSLHERADAHGFRIVTVPADDGGTATLWVHSVGANRSVLFWHGNGELVADHVALADRLASMGWDFVGVELRGFGDAPG